MTLAPPFLLGLTGSIATGKSTVLEMFKEQGFSTFSADDVVHKLYETTAVPIIENIHPRAIKANKVDRSILAEFLIKHPEKIPEIEAKIHPLVRKEYQLFVDQAHFTNQSLVILDIPLLFENKSNYNLDAVAVTFCSNDEQHRRALARPGMTQQKLSLILSRQISQDNKRKMADFEIDTNGPLSQTRAQTVEIIKQCLALRKSR